MGGALGSGSIAIGRDNVSRTRVANPMGQARIDLLNRTVAPTRRH